MKNGKLLFQTLIYFIIYALLMILMLAIMFNNSFQDYRLVTGLVYIVMNIYLTKSFIKVIRIKANKVHC